MKKDLHNFVFLLGAIMLVFIAASFYSSKIQKTQKVAVEKEMRFANRTHYQGHVVAEASMF